MDSQGLINILTLNTAQAGESINLCLQSANKNTNFLEFLKNAVLSETDSEINVLEDVNVAVQENYIFAENREMFSEIILQLLALRNQNSPVDAQKSAVLPIIFHGDENLTSVDNDSKSGLKVLRQKSLAGLLASIINSILKTLSDNKEIEKDSNLDENTSNKPTKDISEKCQVNESDARTITIILTDLHYLNRDRQIKVEQINTDYTSALKEETIGYKPSIFSEINPGLNNTSNKPTKDISEKCQVNESDARTITIILTDLHYLNRDRQIKVEQINTDYTSALKEESGAYKPVLLPEDLDKKINMMMKEEATMPSLNEKGIELKVDTDNEGLSISKPKFAWENKLYDISPNLEEIKNTQEHKKKIESKEQGFVYERINAYDIGADKIANSKTEGTIRISHQEIAERIEKIIDRFSHEKETADMVIKFRLNENDILHVSLKREGAHISVNIKSTNMDVISMFYAQKETIVKDLEEKNVFTEIFVYPDGSQHQKNGQTNEDNRKHYRKRKDEREFYEVLMTQEV